MKVSSLTTFNSLSSKIQFRIIRVTIEESNVVTHMNDNKTILPFDTCVNTTSR